MKILLVGIYKPTTPHPSGELGKYMQRKNEIKNKKRARLMSDSRIVENEELTLKFYAFGDVVSDDIATATTDDRPATTTIGDEHIRTKVFFHDILLIGYSHIPH